MKGLQAAREVLSLAYKESRLAACNYCPTFTEHWFLCRMVRREMVCFETVTKQADRQIDR